MNIRLMVLCAGALAFGPRVGADSGTGADFNEVRSVLLEHMSGGTEAVLNRAAVLGLLSELKGRAELLNEVSGTSTNTLPLVASSRRFDGEVGYVRIQRVEAGLAQAVSGAVSALQNTNPLAGLVIDLRFANGRNYGAAAATVDLFLAQEMPLMNAGEGLVRSKEKTNALTMPVVALVNRETAAAAEALAAILRQTGVGLLIGEATAGRAGITSDYQLSTGQTLRVMTAPVQLGDAKALSADGVSADVSVMVKAEDEVKYYEDPFVQLDRPLARLVRASDDGTGPVASRRIRVTEADLVREKRGDGDLETVAGERIDAETGAPKISDPALARAIDLLKGLAVVRQWKS